MSSKRPKLPIAKEKPKLSLVDTMKLKTEKLARLYKQLQPTIIALRQAPENTPDHITAVAHHPLTIDAQKGLLEASQAQSTNHHTTVFRKNFALHILQRSRTRNLQEDTPVMTTLLCHEPHTSHPDP